MRCSPCRLIHAALLLRKNFTFLLRYRIELGIGLLFACYKINLRKIGCLCRIVVASGAERTPFMKELWFYLCGESFSAQFRIPLFPVEYGIVELATLAHERFNYPVESCIFIQPLFNTAQKHRLVSGRSVIKHDGDVSLTRFETDKCRLRINCERRQNNSQKQNYCFHE